MVLGLDGATFDLIKPWAAQGLLPTFSRLMEEGSWGTLRSVSNLHSAAAWTSAVTGVNPGKHGIYFFAERMPEGEFKYYCGGQRRFPAFWVNLDRAGLRQGIINIPMSYPVDRINGVMIAGCRAANT